VALALIFGCFLHNSPIVQITFCTNCASSHRGATSCALPCHQFRPFLDAFSFFQRAVLIRIKTQQLRRCRSMTIVPLNGPLQSWTIRYFYLFSTDSHHCLLCNYDIC
jgi:hypothetical protein